MGEQLDDDTVEHLLSGTRDGDDLGRLLGAIKAEFDAIDAPEPSPALQAFIDDASSAAGVATAPTDELSIARKRRRRVAAVAVAGTTLGKLMIGMSAAAASVAGLHATGMVDVPVLPNRGQPPESVAIDTTNPAPATTLRPTISPQPTVPADILYSFDAVDAGTVDIGVTDNEVVSAIANAEPGWKSQVSTTDAAVEVAFNRARDRVDVRAVLDGGLLHVVISDRRAGTTEEFWLDNDNNPTLPDRAPEPEQRPELTPAPANAGTDDNEADDSTPAARDDTSGDDRSDDDTTDDDTTDDDTTDDDTTEDDRSDDDVSDDDRTDDASDDDTSDDDRSDDDTTDDDTTDDDTTDDDARLDNDESD